jgi:predicted GNAT family acetyltransferase
MKQHKGKSVPEITVIHCKTEIEQFALQNPYLHLFELGDLDDYYWPHTIWYGWQVADQLQQLALIYTRPVIPVLLAYAEAPIEAMRDFLQALMPLLPGRLYAHLSPQAVDVLTACYQIESRGLYLKMGLTEPERISRIDTSVVKILSEADRHALQRLYEVAHPDNFFDPRTLAHGLYTGIYQDDMLVSAAGLHIYALFYKVAAVGNVATHPAYRGRGFSTQVCASLCQKLLAEGITHIGLNVAADNAPAIGVYTRLGFTPVAEYGAYQLKRWSHDVG